MNEHRPLRLSMLIIDALRLVIIIASLTFLRSALNSTSIAGLGGFAIAAAVPQAFFLLIPLFLWIDFVRYRNYVPLYIAGKAISAFTIAVWLFTSVPAALVALELGDIRALALSAAALILAIWDTGSALLAGLTLARGED